MTKLELSPAPNSTQQERAATGASSVRVGLAIFLALIYALVGAISGRAQNGIAMEGQAFTYSFGESLRFEAHFTSVSDLVDGHVVLQVEGVEELFSFPAQLDGHGGFVAEVEIPVVFDPPALREIEYWYLVGAEDGNIFESAAFSFAYTDNRFVWQQISEGGITVNWYAGEVDFAQAILDAAKDSVSSVQRIIPLAGPETANFHIYADQESLLETMASAGYQWAAGHSDLSRERIFLAISPKAEASLEIKRQVPHEMAHLMLYRALGKGAYDRLPRWLDEGIASNAELYSDPLFPQLLRLAYVEGSLPSLFALCEAFPQDAATARLAYATAAAFVTHLRSEYQVVGMGAIVDAYARNDDCMFALESLLGKNLLELETEWQTSKFGQTVGVAARLEQVPWQIWLLLTFGIGLIIWLRRGDKPA